MASLTDRQIERLAAKLEARVSKRALARMIATNAVVAGLASGENPAAVEADLMTQTNRYETLQALRRAKEVSDQVISELQAQGFSGADHRLLLKVIGAATHSLIESSQSEGNDS